MPDISKDRIARRIKAIRDQRRLTQQALSERMGLSHRQTLASIEAGERAITPEELVQVATALEVPLEALTDPFQLVGEGEFSFRAEGVAPEVLEAFQQQAGQWVATARVLLERSGVPRSHWGQKLELTPASSFEDAQGAAEEVRRSWDLGDTPAALLRRAIEDHLGVQVLFVDAPRGISGAAVQLPGMHTILINRREPAGRRHFDLAHELFHILTWDAMAPDHVEPRDVPLRKGNRVEKLAENFAGALLMPADVVSARWREKQSLSLVQWLNDTASELLVTAVALKWRLVVLGLQTKAEMAAVDDGQLVGNGRPDDGGIPTSFSAGFVRMIHEAVEDGHLSLRRASRILGIAPRDFGDLCGAYGLDLSYEV